MFLESILIAFIFGLVASGITYVLMKSQAKDELADYRTRVSNDFRRLTETIYARYGVVENEVVPEYTDEDGVFYPTTVVPRQILESKLVAAALVDYQASLYR